MAVFHYVACNADGQMREGELEACSPREAAQIVRGQMLRVIHIGKAAGTKKKGVRLSLFPCDTETCGILLQAACRHGGFPAHP